MKLRDDVDPSNPRPADRPFSSQPAPLLPCAFLSMKTGCVNTASPTLEKATYAIHPFSKCSLPVSEIVQGIQGLTNKPRELRLHIRNSHTGREEPHCPLTSTHALRYINIPYTTPPYTH